MRQVSAALDAITDIAGAEVNIHVLMALAAFASVFMGNALEGGLLLAMFNLASFRAVEICFSGIFLIFFVVILKVGCLQLKNFLLAVRWWM